MRLFALPLLLLPALLTAQSLLLTPRDARSQAAGGTGVAWVNEYAAGLNPAALARTALLTAATSYEQPFGMPELGVASAGVTYRNFGLHLGSLSAGSYAETYLAIGYGRDLQERLRLGGRMGLLHGVTTGYAPQASPVGALGLQYDPTDRLSTGLVVHYVADPSGSQVQWDMGLAYQPDRRVSLAVEGHYLPTVGWRTRVGARYQPATRVMLYLGLRTADPEMTFGVGWRVAHRLQLTVAAAVHQVLGWSPSFGLALVPRKRGAKPE